MITSSRVRQTVLVPASAIAVALLASACGGASPMPARAAAPTTAAASAKAAPSVALANTPSATGVAISEEILHACNIPDRDAYFAFDSSRLTSFDHGPLDAVASCFTQGPLAARRLTLVGHADPRGGPEYNMTLGQSRADAVATYLADRGVQRENESATSRGALDATGRDETGWAHDRRVDVMLAN